MQTTVTQSNLHIVSEIRTGDIQFLGWNSLPQPITPTPKVKIVLFFSPASEDGFYSWQMPLGYLECEI